MTVVAAFAFIITAFHHQSVACYKIPHHHHKNFQCNGNVLSSTIKSRRKFIISTAASVISPLILPHTVQAAEDNFNDITTTKEVAQYIQKHTNQSFLRSVIESDYNFLYRGLSSDSNKKLQGGNNIATVVVDEPFDLLDFETYGSDEAVKYFQSLEIQMNDGKLSMRPSNSHIATTCPKEAAKWGAAVSIWPLSEQGVQFAWLENGGIFWPASATSGEIANSNGSPDIERGRGLSRALKGDAWEIMFQADNGFLAVRATYDDELKQLLRQIQAR